jgi:hypothetical protein
MFLRTVVQGAGTTEEVFTMTAAVARSSRDVDRARALHGEIKLILESRPSGALEDVQRCAGWRRRRSMIPTAGT